MKPRQYLGIAALIATAGIGYQIKNFITDSTEPCVEIKTSNGKLELNISDSNSTCTTRTRTPLEKGTIDTLVTYTRINTNYYSNIEKVEVFVDGEHFTNIPLEKQGPNVNSSAPLNLLYGKHEIKVQAYDTAENKGEATLAIFAYSDGITDLREIDEDKDPPQLNGNGFLGRKRIIRDNQSGIRTLEIKDQNGENLLSKVYQQYIKEIDLGSLLAKGKNEQLTIHLSDHNGNTLEQDIDSYISTGKGHMGGE
ncbi:MAG: hypothetical protein Q8R18_01460 [bacterium]|nr:hypothetical protein [bacterium]